MRTKGFLSWAKITSRNVGKLLDRIVQNEKKEAYVGKQADQGQTK
jgi:hypothetical protein